MFNFDRIKKIKERCTRWLFEHAEGPHGQVWLAIIAFSESIILPVPTIALLVPILMVSAKRWLYFATLASIFSVLGGIVGYFVGVFFFDIIGGRIIDFYSLGSQLVDVTERFNENTFLVIFIGAFTPIPYKVFVLTAGFLKVNFITFVLASVLGRSLQLFLIAYVMRIYGERITAIVLKYLNISVLVALVLLIFIFFI